VDTKSVKQDVNGTVIHPPLVFPEMGDVIFAKLVCPLNDVIFVHIVMRKDLFPE